MTPSQNSMCSQSDLLSRTSFFCNCTAPARSAAPPPSPPPPAYHLASESHTPFTRKSKPESYAPRCTWLAAVASLPSRRVRQQRCRHAAAAAGAPRSRFPLKSRCYSYAIMHGVSVLYFCSRCSAAACRTFELGTCFRISVGIVMGVGDIS